MDLRSRRMSEKSQLEIEAPTPADLDIEMNELGDVITELSPVKSVHPRASIGSFVQLLKLSQMNRFMHPRRSRRVNLRPSFGGRSQGTRR